MMALGYAGHPGIPMMMPGMGWAVRVGLAHGCRIGGFIESGLGCRRDGPGKNHFHITEDSTNYTGVGPDMFP